MDDTRSDAEATIKLALIKDAVRGGASEDAIGQLLARMDAEALCTFEHEDGGSIHVKVDRVHGVGPNYDGGTVMVFTDLPTYDPRYRVVLRDELHRVIRRLRENGWKH